MSTTDIKQLTDDQALRALYAAKAEFKLLPDSWSNNPAFDQVCDNYARLWNECHRRGLLD